MPEAVTPRGPRKTRLLVVAAVVALAVLYTFLREMGVVGTWKLSRTHSQIEEENKALHEEIVRLREEVRRLQTNPKYIEEIARKDLGLVGSGENVIIIDRGATAAPAPKGGTKRP